MRRKLLRLTTASLYKMNNRDLAVIQSKIAVDISKGGLRQTERTKLEDLLRIIRAIGLKRLDEAKKEVNE